MERPRDLALREIEELLASARRLRADLLEKEASYRRMARRLERGTDIATAMDSVRAYAARQELTDQIKEFEHCRHRTRIAITAAGLDEGMTIGDLGRAWGFSRQLAARYAREARESL